MPGLPRRNFIIFSGLLIVILALTLGVYLVRQQTVQPASTEPREGFESALSKSPGLVEARGELVSGFPEFPVYPEVKLTYSSRYDLEEETVYRASWISDDSLSQIAEYYGSALRKAGWTVTETKEPTQGDSLIEATKNNQTATLYIDQEGRGGLEDQEAPTRILVVIYLQQ